MGIRGKLCARLPQALVLTFIAVFACIVFAGCSESSSSQDYASSKAADDLSPIRIGTMPTEDFLPMWAAEKDGDFESVNMNVELISFDSAQALSAAIAANEIDMAMVDIPRAVKLCESGTPIVLEWVTLGEKAEQGAFGVMAAKDAPYNTLNEMAEYMASHDDSWARAGVGVAANTVPEYVFEKLCLQAGIDPATLKVEEVASLPERYSLMAEGRLSAAALPASMLRLGEASGMKLLAEDTTGDNISQSVMIATQQFNDERVTDVISIAQAWNMAANAINSDPKAYTDLLADKTNLNESVIATYKLSEYPNALRGNELIRPTSDMVDPQLEWMASKGYISKQIAYDQQTGTFAIS